MNDKEIVDLIATKLMGWTPITTSNGWLRWVDSSGRKVADRDGIRGFNPLTNAADSKMVRDKLADTHDWQLIQTRGDAGFTVFVIIDKHTSGTIAEAIGRDEFRAVCECAVKVLTA